MNLLSRLHISTSLFVIFTQPLCAQRIVEIPYFDNVMYKNGVFNLRIFHPTNQFNNSPNFQREIAERWHTATNSWKLDERYDDVTSSDCLTTLSSLHWYLDNNDQLVPSQKDSFVYANGKLIDYLEYGKVNLQVEYNGRRRFFYQSNSTNPDSSIYTGTPSSDTTLYEYNNARLITLVAPRNSQFRRRYIYNNSNNLMEIIDERLSNSTWISTFKSSYAYTTQNKLRQFQFVNLMAQPNSVESQIDYSYDNQNLLKNITGYRGGAFHFSAQILSYNALNRPTTIEIDWSGINVGEIHKETLTYQNDTIVRQILVQRKNGATGSYVNYLRSTIDYCGIRTNTKDMREDPLDVNIYPMPVQHTEAVTLSLVLHKETSLSYQIYDLFGKVVQQKQLTPLSVGEHTIPIKVDDLSNGIWFISLKVDNQTRVTKKFIVQH